MIISSKDFGNFSDIFLNSLVENDSDIALEFCE
jgi:hypothetical protein